MTDTGAKGISLDKVLSRQAFIKSTGRISLLLALFGLGGFLFKRNTCSHPTASWTAKVNPCRACSENSDCELTRAEQFRASRLSTERDH